MHASVVQRTSAKGPRVGQAFELNQERLCRQVQPLGQLLDLLPALG